MSLAEQIRRRFRPATAVVSSSGAYMGQATTQEAVNAALKGLDSGAIAYINNQIAAFGTSMAATYEPKVTAGTSTQFYRGNKTWAAVAINDVTGLSSALSGLSDASAGKVAKAGDTMTGPLMMPGYVKASLPAVSANARSMIYVTDLTGGAEFCYSDGTNWRRMSDRSIAN